MSKNISNRQTEIRIKVVPAHERETSEIMTLFEYSSVLSTRATQIENNSIVYVDTTGLDNPVDIAKKEIMCKKCPLSIQRDMEMNGTIEIWDVNEMIVPAL